MLGIGWPELFLVGIVALIAIGPKDLPPLMKQLGKWTRKARQMYGEFQKHWEDLPNQVGLEDMQKEADALRRKTYAQFDVDEPVPDEKAADEEALREKDVAPPSDKPAP